MRLLPLLTYVLLPVAMAPAQSTWSRFRGPAGQGVAPATGLPATFTPANVRWRVSAGTGHSSPVLHNDRLFLTREGAAPDSRDVVCFEAASGKQVWATACAFEPHALHALNSSCSSTPAVDDSGIYVVWSSAAELQALALDHNGQLRWQRRLGGFAAQHGSGSSPILFEDLLIVANENESETSFVVALDKQTGAPRWHLPRRSVEQRGSYATPIVHQPAEGPAFLLLASSAHGLSAVAPGDGGLLWEIDLELTTRCVAGPCVSGDRVLVLAGTGGGGKEAAVVRIPDPGAQPSVSYRPRRNLPYVPNALALRDRFYLFADGGTASCLDAGSGDVIWRERLPGTFFSSPVSNGETLYIASRDGELFSLGTGAGFELFGKFDLGAAVFATPVIGAGALFVRTATELVRLDSGPTAEPAAWSRFRGPNGTGLADTTGLPVAFGPDRNVAWRTPLPPGHSSPVLSATHVFVTAVDGERLETICLERKTGAIAWRVEAPRPRITKVDTRNNAASPTPAVNAELVVVFFADFGMLAYDHGGKERWRVPLGPFHNLYGMGASPVIDGDKVFLACDQNRDSFVLAAAVADGKELWRTDRPRATSGHCTPILLDASDGTRQLVLPGSFLLDAYDVQSGQRAWWVRGLSFEMKSVPTLHDGTIYINGYGSPLNQAGTEVVLPPFAEVLAASDADRDGVISPAEMPKSRASEFFEAVDLDGKGTLDGGEWEYLRDALASRNGLLAIRAGGKGDMTGSNVLWSYRRSVPQLPSPLIYRDVLYMLGDQGGLLTTLRPDSGEVIERGRLEKAIDNYYASPVAGDDKVYLVSEGGLVSVLPAGGSLEPLAVNDLGEACYATPALADGCIYLRTHGALYCFAAR